MSSNTWLNHIVLGHPINLFPLNFKSNTLLSILVLSILFTWLNHCSHNKLWIAISSLKIDSIPSSVYPQHFSEISYPLHGVLLLFFLETVHIMTLNVISFIKFCIIKKYFYFYTDLLIFTSKLISLPKQINFYTSIKSLDTLFVT